MKQQEQLPRESPYDRLAEEYDRWFDDSAVFRVELACLLGLNTKPPDPCLEIGVGPGRFAEKLGFGFGADPALGALRLAVKRGIKVFCAIGEDLPLISGCFKSVVLLFSLCFVEDPAKVLQEAHRVLGPGGILVIGMIPAASLWGQAILKKKKENNPFYSRVNLLGPEQVSDCMKATGFAIEERRCALLQPPGGFAGEVDARPGMNGDAGFVVLVGRKEP